MNLILLSEREHAVSPQRIRLSDRRFEHITKVHRAQVGDRLKLGVINGSIGSAIVEDLQSHSVELSYALDTPPPPALPLTLILALPRPKVLRRTLQNLSSLGAKHIILINTWRVEKSYWQSPLLESASIEHSLQLGLEQAVDTIMPTISQRKRFKPFVEDELGALAKESVKLVAHPKGNAPCPMNLGAQASTLAIGPEGGFIPYEIEKLESIGFQAVNMGQRILTVETAIPTLIGQLFPR
ncbi:conserved hypothetical protein TIGR00046 [gamma proteobacterium HTCC5015]|nr:conserved hypothetical protein TIGR00046 [gamma proteobacterium HTCC5015]